MTSSEHKIDKKKYEYKILWFRVFMGFVVSSGALLGIYYLYLGEVKAKTYISTLIFFLIGGIGTGPGAHRYFSHHSFKAVRGLKIFLIFSQQIAGMKSVIFWCQIHRTHHKFSDTDADPTNIKRGLFFSFLGWIFITPTPEYTVESERIGLDDLTNDKELALQEKFYPLLYVTITLLLPTIIPFYIWNESFYIAFCMNMLRYALNIFQLAVGNGLLHLNGPKPYDSTSSATDNVLYNILTLGEGFHNYHHTFPFDYRNNERSSLWYINSLSTFFIDICAIFGLAYDKKIATPEMIKRRVMKTGDGSHWLWKTESNLSNGKINKNGIGELKMSENGKYNGNDSKKFLGT